MNNGNPIGRSQYIPAGSAPAGLNPPSTQPTVSLGQQLSSVLSMLEAIENTVGIIENRIGIIDGSGKEAGTPPTQSAISRQVSELETRLSFVFNRLDRIAGSL